MNSPFITLLWKSGEYHSEETCLIQRTKKGIRAESVIAGGYKHQAYKVEYLVRTNTSWETLFVEIKFEISDSKQVLSYQSDGKGNWTANGIPVTELKDCTDVDIPLTPFTNTLPIKRLDLSIGESRQIGVVYTDLLNNTVKPVKQKYTRLSLMEYQYENVPNDFEARLVVDELGFIMHYPGLFERVETDAKF